MRRSAESSSQFELDNVRDELAGALSEIDDASVLTGRAADIASLERPLRCFIDVVMSRGEYPWSDRWESFERASRPDDVLLAAASEATTAAEGRAPSEAEREQIEVLYTCLCFCGDLLTPGSQAKSVDELLEQMGTLVRQAEGAADRVCPSAYQGVFTRSILPPVGMRIRAMLGGSVALLLLGIAAAVTLNVRYSQSLEHSITVVQKALKGTSSASPANR